MAASSEWGQDNSGSFRTTHWSVVLAASQNESSGKQDALAKLCQDYWYPLYVYIRRCGHDVHNAKDLTQDFFQFFLEKDVLAVAGITREGGKFRSFLLTVLKRFLANEWARSQAQKRGGGQTILSLDAELAENRYSIEPADHLSPDIAFEQNWANTLLERVMSRLETEYKHWRKGDLFREIQIFLCSKKEVPYADVGARLGMSAGAVKTAVCRLRKRYGQLLHEEIARTVATLEEVEEEIRHLIAVLNR
jgi:RNA polymerase sigma factor (sigma-70 family)